VYLVPDHDIAVFTLGRFPRNPVLEAAVSAAAEKASRLFRARQTRLDRVLEWTASKPMTTRKAASSNLRQAVAPFDADGGDALRRSANGEMEEISRGVAYEIVAV